MTYKKRKGLQKICGGPLESPAGVAVIAARR